MVAYVLRVANAMDLSLKKTNSPPVDSDTLLTREWYEFQ
jgi:hypothetical protein